MNIMKQNNPVVVGILLIILCFSLGKSIMTLLNGRQLAPAPANAPAPTVEQDAKLVKLPESDRDPFAHPAVFRMAVPLEQGGSKPAIDPEKEKKENRGGASITTSLPTFMPVPIQSNRSLTPEIKQAEHKKPIRRSPGDWKMVAMLKGDRSAALIELPDGEQVRVVVGDKIYDFQVVTIRENEIVVQAGGDIWTVPRRPSDKDGESSVPKEPKADDTTPKTNLPISDLEKRSKSLPETTDVQKK